MVHPTNKICNRAALSLISPNYCLRIAAYIYRSMDQRSIGHYFQSYQEVQQYEYSVMADRSYQRHFNGFFTVFFVWCRLGFQHPHYWWPIYILRHGGIQCTTPVSNTCSVGVIKFVITSPKASAICSYPAVLIKPQTPTNASVTLLTRTP